MPPESKTDIAVVIVLDSCIDRSVAIALAWRDAALGANPGMHIEIRETEFRNVGRARREGCEVLLERWSDVAPQSIWLATTDADSQVPTSWISAQLRVRSEGGQIWAGAVTVDDWSDRSPGTAQAWRRQYEAECLPVHGANFGIDGATYVRAGGFPSSATGEDRELFDRAVGLGAVVRSDSNVRVVTSGRREARAPFGFAHALTSIESAITTSIASEAELTAS